MIALSLWQRVSRELKVLPSTEQEGKQRVDASLKVFLRAMEMELRNE